jgi:pilus assembly protein CpaB
MARRRTPLLILLSLAVGLFAAWIANNWINARATAGQTPKTQVVTAALDIPFGTKIEARHLATIDMLPGTEPAGSFTDRAKVEGRVTRSTMVRGEILLEARLADSGSGSALAAVVEKNMRAVTIRVDDVVGVAGFLLPGNRVDVIATRKEDKDRAVTETILSNVRVLAVDQTAAAEKNEPVVVRAVTLELKPEDAEVLMKGKALGTIQLALRNPLDESVVARKVVAPPPPVARVPVAPPPPAPRSQITVIRGTSVDREAPRN